MGMSTEPGIVANMFSDVSLEQLLMCDSAVATDVQASQAKGCGLTNVRDHARNTVSKPQACKCKMIMRLAIQPTIYICIDLYHIMCHRPATSTTIVMHVAGRCCIVPRHSDATSLH